MTPLLSFAFLVNIVAAQVAISACGQIFLIPHGGDTMCDSTVNGGVRLHPSQPP
jgi:hypothetical protein